MTNQATIQIDYEQVNQVSRRISAQAEACAAMRQCVVRALVPLQQGGWEGAAGGAFFAEMEREVLPALVRLESALAVGRASIDEIAAMLRAAEEEASRLFAGSTDSADSVDGAPVAPPAFGDPPPLHADRTKLYDQIFNKSYMDEMVGRTWQGEGDPRLRGAIKTLLGSPGGAERDAALDAIAELRGLDREAVAAQYKAVEEHRETLRKKGEAIEMPRVFQDGFLGSRDQLRYGQIVGDKLGLDPALAVLLNPTGGLPGPGNKAIQVSDQSIMYHSAFHDAAGFLYNLEGRGPGYDYLKQEGHRSKSNPFTGQESGLDYWNDKFGDHDRGSYVVRGVGVVLGTVVDIQEVTEDFADGAQRKLRDMADLIF